METDTTSPVSDLPFVDETEQAKQPSPPTQGQEERGASGGRETEAERERGEGGDVSRREEEGRAMEREREEEKMVGEEVGRQGEEEGEISSQSSTPSPRPKAITPRCYMDEEEGPNKRKDTDNQEQYVHCTCTVCTFICM